MKTHPNRNETREASWLFPVISAFSSIALAYWLTHLWHPPRRSVPGYFEFDGALVGAVMSGIAIWMFLRCPPRPPFAKAVSLLSLIVALYFGVVTIGTFVIRKLGI